MVSIRSLVGWTYVGTGMGTGKASLDAVVVDLTAGKRVRNAICSGVECPRLNSVPATTVTSSSAITAICHVASSARGLSARFTSTAVASPGWSAGA